MNSNENSRSPLCTLYAIMGSGGRKKYVNFLSGRIKKKRLDYRSSLKNINSILIILPDDILEALYQLESIMSVMAEYSSAKTYILASESCKPWFENIHGITDLFTYSSKENCFANSDITSVKQKLRKLSIDICLVLDKKPPLIISYIIAKISPSLRVAYKDALPFPFANVRVALSEENTHIIKKNLSLIKILNIPPVKSVKWSVPKERLEEIKLLLIENKIARSARFGVVDLTYIVKRYGEEWAEKLVRNIVTKTDSLKWVIYIEKRPETDKLKQWYASFDLPVFFEFSSSRLTALLSKSKITLSGRSYIFELTNLLHKKSIGLFFEDEIVTYCNSSKLSTGIVVEKKPAENSIEIVTKKVLDLYI